MTINDFLTNNILKETAAVEFYDYNGKMYAVVNGKKTSLDDFLRLAAKDITYAEIVLAIRKKMKTLNYNGTVQDFIKKCFRSRNSKLDVFVKNGTGSIYNDDRTNKKATFDDEEIAYGLGRVDEEVIQEMADEKAEVISNKIYDLYKGKMGEKIYIGDLFGVEKKNVYFHSYKDEGTKYPAALCYNSKKPFPQFPYEIYIRSTIMRGRTFFVSHIVHEVEHLLKIFQSNGATSGTSDPRDEKTIKMAQIPSRIRKPSKADKKWMPSSVAYMKNADELNSFYNQFFVFLKGKQFKNSLEIRKLLISKLPRFKDNIEYYLKDNKEIKKYFMKRFYLDGIIKPQVKKENINAL